MRFDTLAKEQAGIQLFRGVTLRRWVRDRRRFEGTHRRHIKKNRGTCRVNHETQSQRNAPETQSQRNAPETQSQRNAPGTQSQRNAPETQPQPNAPETP